MNKAKLFVLIVISVIIVAITLEIIFSLGEERRIDYSNVRVEDLVICNGLDPETGRPQEIASPLPSDLGHIYLCGYLVSDGPVELDIYLFHEPETRAVNYPPPNDLFEKGYFAREIVLPTYDPVGHYRIDIYLFRTIIASTEFEISR